MPKAPRGRFVWFDLMSTDPEAAKTFYTKLIGWTVTPFEMEGMDKPYEMFGTDEGPIGGVMQLPEQAAASGAPTHWLGYIATPDVDATVKQATGLGGSVYMPAQDIPTVGRFAVLADPKNAVFSAFAGSGDWKGHDGPAHDGEVAWVELYTEDYENTFEFYNKCFGWVKTEAMDMGEQGVYQMFGLAGSSGSSESMGGIMNRPPMMPANAFLFYFQVKDLDAKAEEAKSMGAQIIVGPMDVPGGTRIVMCLDPQGGGFAMCSTPST